MKYVDIKAVLQLARNITSDAKTLTSNAEELRSKLSALEGTFHDDGFNEVNEFSKSLVVSVVTAQEALSKIVAQLLDYANLLSLGKGTVVEGEMLSESGLHAQEGKNSSPYMPSSSSDSANVHSETPLQKLTNYMSLHNYGEEDYNSYVRDPEWRVLHRAAFPNSPLPPLSIDTARKLLTQYMCSHNYGKIDYPVYSRDPLWQEIHKYAFPAPRSRPTTNNVSAQYSSAIKSLDGTGVSYRPIQLAYKEKTSEDIISYLGGGDKTEGSCSSLAFAYAGNRAGYDVLDYRDGQSRRFFSSNASIELIATLPGVKSVIVRGTDDISCANNLLRRMDERKEYYLATGEHAAIVRRLNGQFEYLELQHATSNGWRHLDDFVLTNRFHCYQANTFDCPNFLIEVDSLTYCDEFLDILGYINTSQHEQHKGVSGNVR